MRSKKMLAAVLASVIILCSFAFGLSSAQAKTQELVLNTEIINTTDGLFDKNWYYFTPEQTGTYTFLSYNRLLHAEAYLFEVDGKNYTQLAYSNLSPNWEYYSQPNKYQFCISYQLEAGKTYFYAAGWDIEKTSGEMKVKLIFEGDTVEKIELECDAELTWYTDGNWETDSLGEKYFFYNYSKILQNMTVKVYYKNGSVSTVNAAAGSVDGIGISCYQNQSESHWYPAEDERYSGNYITISVLNKSAQHDVKINQSALFTFKGKVCDYVSGEAVDGAVIKINGIEKATTDANGEFSFTSAPGVYTLRLSGARIIQREYSIAVDVNSDNNDKRQTPFEVVNSDYVKDGIINAKDYAFIIKELPSDEREAEEAKFEKLINFTEKDY